MNVSYSYKGIILDGVEIPIDNGIWVVGPDSLLAMQQIVYKDFRAIGDFLAHLRNRFIQEYIKGRNVTEEVFHRAIHLYYATDNPHFLFQMLGEYNAKLNLALEVVSQEPRHESPTLPFFRDAGYIHEGIFYYWSGADPVKVELEKTVQGRFFVVTARRGKEFEDDGFEIMPDDFDAIMHIYNPNDSEWLKNHPLAQKYYLN